MKQVKELPGDSAALVALLDRMFPSRCPDLNMSKREIFYYAGQRAIVDWLLTRMQIATSESIALAPYEGEGNWYDAEPTMRQYIEGEE